LYLPDFKTCKDHMIFFIILIHKTLECEDDAHYFSQDHTYVQQCLFSRVIISHVRLDFSGGAVCIFFHCHDTSLDHCTLHLLVKAACTHYIKITPALD